MFIKSIKHKPLIYIIPLILISIIFSGCGAGKSRITIKRFSPEGEVPRKTNFTITFSQPVVLSESTNIWCEPTSLKIDPPIEGRCKWISQNELRFFPEEQLRPSTKYRFEVLPRSNQLKGRYLAGKRVFEFNTARLKVSNYSFDYRVDEKAPGQARIYLTLEFNYEIVPLDLQESFKINFERGPFIDYQIDQKNPSSILTVVSELLPIKDIERKIKLRIDKNLKVVDGTLSLFEDYKLTLRMPARQRLVIERAYPERSAEANWATVQFSTPVDIKVIQDFIQIEPPLDFNIQVQHPYIYIHGKFQPGEDYILTLKKGLPALNGNRLENEFSTQVNMRDLEPSFDFVTKGIFLLSKGNLNVGIQTVNIDKLELSVEKIFINNLVYFLNRNQMYSRWFSTNYLGKHITEKEIEIEKTKNLKVTTTVNMGDYLGDERQGIYILVLRSPESRWDRRVKWVRLTDLGIMAKIAQDELIVFINSLQTLAAEEGVKVKLHSRCNQVLFEGFTDSEGVVRFKNYRAAIKGFDPFVITAEKGKDLSFMKLNDCRLSLADFDVGGAPILKEGYEAFVYTDRGVYRPGDTVHLASIIRDSDNRVPPDFPIKHQVIAPDGSIFNEYRGWVGDAGADEFDISIPIYAMTGVYTSKILIADSIEIGRIRFNVEEFMPQRIKVDISLDKASYQAGEEVKLDVQGTLLFGPPAAGRRVTAQLTISPTLFKSKEFGSFRFGSLDKEFDKVIRELGEKDLDGEGKKTYKFPIPDNMKPPSALIGNIEVSVYELGGRAVTKDRQFMVHPYSSYIGLRRNVKGYAKKDEEVQIDYVVVNPDGNKAQPCSLKLSYYIISWQSILERDHSGIYRYVSEKSLDLIEKKKIFYNGEISSVSFIPHHYGQYMVMIEDLISSAVSSIEFYVSGWGYVPWAMSEPEKLKIDFDKNSYQIGEQAVAQIRSPFPGKLVLTFEREGILEQRVIQLRENTATITIPVKKEFSPNVYVVGNLIRSNQSLETHAPIRAYGAYPLIVDNKNRKLMVNLKAPTNIKPLSKMEIAVKVEGGTGKTYLTVAAVDEGVCQITNFVSPDPFEYFYRKKRLSVETYDIYSFILPEIEKVEKKSSPGGGLGEELARRLMPVALRRVKPVALWSGILRTDQSGNAIVRFEIPQFQGSLRVMAVAFDQNRYGSSSKNVTVSDPIVLTPTFPRFLSGKDSFDIPVSVYNGVDAPGKVIVKLSVDGPVKILSSRQQTINIPSKKEQMVKFTCQAGNEIGALHFRLDASGFGSETRHDVDIPLRPASPLVTKVGVGRIEDDGEAAFKIDPDWYSGTTRFNLSLSAFPTINFGHSLRFLLQYPHGCIEQTTSKVFPLLYFSDIAKVVEPSLFKDRSADYYIQEGIAKLRSMQMANGAFAYWPGATDESEWGSIYATHFLVEAQKAGYQIPDRTLSRAAKHLNTFLREKSGTDSYQRSYQLERQIYAAYVLALYGQPDKSTMNYIKQAELKNISTWGQFLLAGAFALLGDVNTAMEMIPFNIAPSDATRETGGNFNSGTRENAIMLEILSEVDPSNPSIPILVETLSERLKDQHYYTTQENAYGFMALGKSLRGHKQADYKGKVWWDDELLTSFDNKNKAIEKKGGEGKQVKIKIDGKGPCFYYWNFSGIKKGEAIEEYNRGLRVNRIYLDKDGYNINYKNIKQSEIIIAKITMTALTDNLENVIITDMLPAGLEIENPRLESRATINWIGHKSVVPDYMDIRDDRINIYLNLRKERTVEFYYMLRAVIVGQFVLPPVQGEAMYDPFKSSINNSGMARVVPVE